MLTSIDVHGWHNRPTSLDSALPVSSLDADFEVDVRRLRQELDKHDPRPSQVRNVLIAAAPDLRSAEIPSLLRPLRVTVEEFGQEGAIAFLTADKSFSGFGNSLREAVRDLMDLLLHDFKFYESTPDDALTADALESKDMLRELFVEPR